MNRHTAIVLFLLLVFGPAFTVRSQVNEARSNVKQVRNGKEYYVHIIKKGQSLYMISRIYGVDINELIKENPKVKEGIKADEVLFIPTGRMIETPKKKEKKTEPVVKKETEEVLPPPPPAELPCGADPGTRKKSYRVALMMPLYLTEVDDIDITQPYNDSIDYRPLSFVQFYEGFRIAVDSLKTVNSTMEVHVYDVDKDTAKTRRLLRDPEIKDMDLIIGLLYNNPFRIVSDFAKRNNIPIVNPLSEREQIIHDNPVVFKVRPSLSSQADHLAEYFHKTAKETNIVILSVPESRMRELAVHLKSACMENSLPVKLADSYPACLESLVPDTNNIVVLISDKKASSLDLITKLNEVRSTYRLTVFGLPRWDLLEGMELEYMVNLNVHILAPYFIDYGDTLVQHFVRTFQDIYKTDPDYLAFQGFDVTWYFLNALNEFGTSLQRCVPDYRVRLLETGMHFTRNQGDGFVNQDWEIYMYDNYFLRKVAW